MLPRKEVLDKLGEITIRFNTGIEIPGSESMSSYGSSGIPEMVLSEKAKKVRRSEHVLA